MENEPQQPQQPQQPQRPMSRNQKLAAAGLTALILGALVYGGIASVRQIAFPKKHGHTHRKRTVAAVPAGKTSGKTADHHDPSTKKQDFGSTTIAGVQFESITQEGAIEAGKEGAFNIVLAEGQKPPVAMRAWIGIASGEGSVKSKLEKEKVRHYHSHAEAPGTLPPGSQYWLEVEPVGGPKGAASFTFFTGKEQ